jgi:hypothetical protein
VGSFDTFSLIRLDALDRAEEETGANASEFYAFAARAGDRSYSQLLNRYPFLFNRRNNPLMLQVFGPITTSLAWAAGSYTATLDAPVARNLRGWQVQPVGQNFGYRIVSHIPGDAAITMEAPLQGGVSLPSGTVCTLFRIEYDLALLQDTPTSPAVAPGAAGNPNGTYQYAVAFFNENGETELGDPVTGVVLTSQQGAVSSIPTGPPGTLGRYIYRTATLGTIFYRVGTLSDNVTTTFTDDLADSGLSALPTSSVINTTGGVRQIIGIWPKGQTVRQVEGPVTEAWMREHYPDPPTPTWPPYKYARISDVRIRFSQYPSQDGVLEIPHTYIPVDLSNTVGGSDIVVPRNWRYILSDGMLFHLLEMKNDTRAEKWRQIWEADIVELIRDDEIKQIGLEGSRNQAREEPAY